MEAQTKQPATLTVEETAERLGIGRSLAYEGVRDGTIPSIRIGRRIVVPRQRFEAWLAGEQEEDAEAA